MGTTKTAVLLHGHDVDAEDFLEDAWGHPKEGRLGRIPKAIQIAFYEKAELLIWGGWSPHPEKASAFEMFGYTSAHGFELSEFGDYDPYEVQAILSDISDFNEEVLTTATEIERAIVLCRERSIKKLILVSSPWHIPRCMLAAQQLRTAGKAEGIRICGEASDTFAEYLSPESVVVCEPAHRADLPKWQTARYVKAMFRLAKDEKKFSAFLTDLGDSLRKHGIPVNWKPVG